MKKVSSIQELINLWPTRSSLADDVNAVAGHSAVSVSQVHKWAERGSIAAIYHQYVLTAAERRDYPVTAALLVELHAPKEKAA